MTEMVFCPPCSAEFNADHWLAKDTVEAKTIDEFRCPYCGGNTE